MTLLMDDIQQYLLDFVQQLEQCCRQVDAQAMSGLTCPQISEGETLEPMLRQQVEMLNQAWLRLESEQRELLQSRASSPIAKSEFSPANNYVNRSSAVLPSTLPAPGCSQPRLPTASHPPQADALFPEDALLQEFARLRQDIRSARGTPFV
ncbi:MAG: hypothetical protein NXI32_00080 [bacterium]|nr:hypothetical protein [bacterium]